MEWISVKDRLPELSNEIIITNGKFVMGGYGWYGDYFCDDYDNSIELSDVTHWMPLPRPPKNIGLCNTR